jgi:hypothetical protein
MFDVSASCVIKLMQRVDATGNCHPRNFGGHKHYALAEHEDKNASTISQCRIWVCLIGIRSSRLPSFLDGPKVSAKIESPASIVANRSINGSKRGSGMVGINS